MDDGISLRTISKITGIPRSTIHYNVKIFEKKLKRDELLVKEIKEIHLESGKQYGSPTVTCELNKRGHKINHKKVERLMKENSIVGCIKKTKKWSSYDGLSNDTAQNLIKRDFIGSRPLEKLFNDVTEIKYNGYKLYLCCTIDSFNNEIVYRKIGFDFSVQTLLGDLETQLLWKLDPNQKTIIHTDHGSHYKSNFYITICDIFGVKRSLSAVGKSADNAPIESFFGKLKNYFRTNMPKGDVYDFIDEIYNYIDEIYNKKRIVRRLKNYPVAYRLEWEQKNLSKK